MSGRRVHDDPLALVKGRGGSFGSSEIDVVALEGCFFWALHTFLREGEERIFLTELLPLACRA